MKKITKAVILAAGRGTRFLPATKNVPKELLPLIDMPVLEYITDECVEAGIKDIIIVTSQEKNAIEDYFSSSSLLEQELLKNNKHELLEKVRKIYTKANFIFVRQNANYPYGTATPLYIVRNLIKDGEAFAVIYGDDMFQANGKENALAEMIKSFESHKDAKAMIGVKKISNEDVERYGLVKFVKKGNDLILDKVLEKQKNVKEKENFVLVGRFIYDSTIFKYINLEDYKTNPRGELELTDVENKFKNDFPIFVHKISADWYPTGQPIDFMKSMIRLALKRKDTKDEIFKFLKKIVN